MDKIEVTDEMRSRILLVTVDTTEGIYVISGTAENVTLHVEAEDSE